MTMCPRPRSRITRACGPLAVGLLALLSALPSAIAASLRQGRLLDGAPATGLGKVVRSGGAWTQVSRLGMPLVNELIIDDKDKFNASKPEDDAAKFADDVTRAVLPALIQTPFPSAVAATNFPRADLVTVFLKAIGGVNQPTTVVSAETLRLNTAIAVTPAATQNALGVAAGDSAGFPNGRRPADDVVDLSLRGALGAGGVWPGATDPRMAG